MGKVAGLRVPYLLVVSVHKASSASLRNSLLRLRRAGLTGESLVGFVVSYQSRSFSLEGSLGWVPLVRTRQPGLT
jgi:hypothetical protein